MLAFKTYRWNGRSDPDPEWCAEWAAHARFLWVRLTGLGEPATEETTTRWVRDWERTAMSLAPRRPPGLVLLEVRPSLSLRSGLAKRREWARAQAWSSCMVRAALLRLRAAVPWEIGVWAEDFAARWVGEAGVRVERLVLDNPVVSVQEAAPGGLYGAALGGVPRYVRSSAWAGGLDAEWPRWKMHFPREWLLTGEATGVHGWWHPRYLTRAARDAVLRREPERQHEGGGDDGADDRRHGDAQEPGGELDEGLDAVEPHG